MGISGCGCRPKVGRDMGRVGLRLRQFVFRLDVIWEQRLYARVYIMVGHGAETSHCIKKVNVFTQCVKCCYLRPPPMAAITMCVVHVAVLGFVVCFAVIGLDVVWLTLPEQRQNTAKHWKRTGSNAKNIVCI